MENLRNTKKLKACIILYNWLYEHPNEVWTVRELASKCCSTVRSTRRYMEHLMEIEDAIVSVQGRNGGYIFES